MSRLEWSAVGILLAALFSLQAYEAWTTGVTIDEPSHLLSASLYWQGADRLKPRDMPPLIKFTGGWVPAWMGLPVPADLGKQLSEERHEWTESVHMMSRLSASQVQQVYFRSRLPLLIFPLLTAALIWWWGRQLFGRATGLILMAAFAVEPTALGHGALFKNDLASTFGYLLFWFAAWRFWRRPTLGRVALLGVATLVGAASKLSLLILVPIAPALVAARFLPEIRQRWRQGALGLALVLIIPYAGMIAACQFDASLLTQQEFSDIKYSPHVPRLTVAAGYLFRVIPVPRPLWEGALSLAAMAREDVSVYLWGKEHIGGSLLYFPLALAVKAPVPLLLLGLCGLLAVLAAWRRGRYTQTDLFWLLPGCLYVGLASFCAFQYGVRLVLPALPFGLFLCGAGVEALWRRRWAWLPALALAALAVTSLRVYPFGISFFNVWSGGPEHGLRYLTDSNLDWGQDLPRLSAYLHQSGVQGVRVGYFGPSFIWSYIDDRQVSVLPLPFTPDQLESNPLQLKPGYYALSASLLTGHLWDPEYRDYLKAFRTQEPVARIGYSIYLYRIGPS